MAPSRTLRGIIVIHALLAAVLTAAVGCGSVSPLNADGGAAGTGGGGHDAAVTGEGGQGGGSAGTSGQAGAIGQGGHGGSGGAGVGGAGGAGVGGTGGAGACNIDSDCVYRPGSCCNGTCAAKTDPLPAPGPVCNIACTAPVPSCGCVNHQCATAHADAGAEGGRTDGGSPGSVTLRLVLPARRAFCDSCYGSHITIIDGTGQTVKPSLPSCSATCSSCALPPCAFLPACSQTVPITSELTWDGTSETTSTCGNNVTCYQPSFATVGPYVARMCATPGTLVTADGGFPTTCAATGSMECVDVPFQFPGPSPVVGTLP